jgi:peptidoglycan/LPS O-acetylase OafA/YrhL
VPGPSVPDGAFGALPAVLPWCVAYAGFLLALHWRERRFPASLLWLGLVSYSVYLLHPVLLPIVDDDRFSPWTGLAVLVVGTVVAAAIAQRFVEAPGQALGRRLRARLRATSPRERSGAATSH